MNNKFSLKRFFSLSITCLVFSSVFSQQKATTQSTANKPADNSVYWSKLYEAEEYNNTYCLKNAHGKIVKKAFEGEIGKFADGLACVNVNPEMTNDVSDFDNEISDAELDDMMLGTCFGNYGFVNKSYKIVVPLKYDQAFEFSEGLASVAKCNEAKDRKLWGYIDKTGRVAIPLRFSSAYSFSDGIAWVEDANTKLWFFIDKTGKALSNPIYEHPGFEGKFVNGWSPAGIKEKNVRFPLTKYGFIDNKGKTVIPFIYAECKNFSEGLAAVKLTTFGKNDWIFINTLNQKVAEGFEYAESFRDSCAIVKKNGKYGMINHEGKLIAELKYDRIDKFSENSAIVNLKIDGKDKYGIINNKGVEIVPCIYDNLWNDIYENNDKNVIIATKDKKSGVLNHKGEIVVPFVYDNINFFSCSMAPVQQNGKWGYINTSGKLVIPCVYDYADGFVEYKQWAKVEKDNQILYINKAGQVMRRITY